MIASANNTVPYLWKMRLDRSFEGRGQDYQPQNAYGFNPAICRPSGTPWYPEWLDPYPNYKPWLWISSTVCSEPFFLPLRIAGSRGGAIIVAVEEYTAIGTKHGHVKDMFIHFPGMYIYICVCVLCIWICIYIYVYNVYVYIHRIMPHYGDISHHIQESKHI